MPTFSAVQILTASIAPVIVISGIGLLLLSITNRYGRAIDRVRLLARELEEIETESAQRRAPGPSAPIYEPTGARTAQLDALCLWPAHSSCH